MSNRLAAVRRLVIGLCLLLGAARVAWSQVPDAFDPGSNDYIYAVALQPDGKVVIGGNFTFLNCKPFCGGTAVARNRIARLNSDGSIDSTFNPGTNAPVWGLAVQPDGKIVAIGQFSTVGGGTGSANTIGRVARFNSDGSVDTSFNAGNSLALNLNPLSMVLQADGKIIIGGQFTVAQGQTHWFITRLNTDGTVDGGYAANVWSHVYTMAIQADGKLVIGGVFTFAGGPNADQYVRNHIARLNTDGTVDTTFDPGADGNVETLTIQADGKIVITGNFTTVGGGGTGNVARNKIARLNADGSVDLAWNPGVNNQVYTLVEQTDGRLLVGGNFTMIGGGGTGTVARSKIARLNADGSVDGAFTPEPPNSVNGLTVQPDGKILTVGSFTQIGGASRNYVARLSNDPATQSITVTGGGNTINWFRGGANGEVWRVEFASSTDGVNYTTLGAGTRQSGGWQLTGVTLPVHPNLTIRARGYPQSGWATSSGSIIEYVVPMPNFNVINNGTFTNGSSGWSQFAVPSNGMVSQVTNGVFEFYRTGTQAVVFSNTSVAFPTDSAIHATFELGNTASTRKRISVLIHEGDFSDLSVCTFWLPANSPLTTYVIDTHTTKAWTSLNISFYAASLGSAGTGFYQLDNVLVQYNPGGPTTATTCDDAISPVTPGGAAGPNLLGNGDFSSGSLAPWSMFGNINGAVTGGVFEFNKTTAAAPTGVLLQQTGQAMTANQILTATFQLGNSSGVRKRVTILLHDSNFTDLSACTFWLAPGQALATYTYRTFATQAWADATVSVYPATVGPEQWIRLDNVTLQRTPGGNQVGTHCIEPGGTVPDQAPPAGWGPGLVRNAGPADAAPSAGDWLADGFTEAPGTTAGAWTAIAAAAGQRILELADPLDLGDQATAHLRLQSWLNAATSRAEIQVSVDGSTWETVHRVRASDGWAALDVDLSAYAGEIIQLRFVLETPTPVDAADPDVWRIDDIEVGP